jgi:hypothetical protein
MKNFKTQCKQIGRLVLVLLVLAAILVIAYRAAVAEEPATPQIRKILDYPANQPLNSTNTDCTNLTYHFEGDSTMQSGCFVGTTHGFMQNGEF